MKILIIEDEKGMATVLKKFLEPLASEIIIARKMDEALKIVSEADELHLITIDLGLPDSDVQSTLLRISEIRKQRPDSLIVVVTGQEIHGLEEESLRQGADGVIYKQGDNFTSHGFLTVIGKLVSKFLAEPTNLSRSLTLLEKVSSKLAEIKTNENTIPSDTANS